MRLLFVCLGNICRSPTGEAVMARLVREAGLADEVSIDSAGTGAYHLGSAPDPRSTAAAAARGTTLAGTARQVSAADFGAFDLLLCADRSNVRALLALAPDAAAAERVRLLREFDPASVAAGELDVPDPYLGEDGFDAVLDVIEAACAGLLAEVRKRLARRPVRVVAGRTRDGSATRVGAATGGAAVPGAAMPSPTPEAAAETPGRAG